MGVPNVFGSATTSIPLSQLDQNFNTTATLGNAAIGLGNVTTTVGNLTLTNVNITSGTINAAVTQSGFTGNSVIYSNTSGNLTTSANMTFNGTTLTLANDASISGLTVGKGGGTNNTIFGYQTAASLTTGQAADYYGYQSGKAVTSGNQNAAFGYNTLTATTTGSNNAAFGSQTMQSNTTGGNNTAIGFNALLSNTTASNNTAVGYQSSYSNTTGISNTSVGQQALYANTTGGGNVAIGIQALSANTTGFENVAIGGGYNQGTALNSNTTGSFNTAVGNAALKNNTTASYSTAVGWAAAYTNTTGQITAIGNNALYSNTTGITNTAIGVSAGYNITTGNNNVCLGAGAGVYTNPLTTGSQCLYVGTNAGPSSASVTYEMVIGCLNSTGKGSTTGYINPQGGGVYQGNNSATWSITSDARLKKNIVNNNTGLDLINQIQVRNFEYRLPEEITELEPTCAIERTGIQLGVIAQEIKQVSEEFVKTESTGVMSVDTDNLVWYLINAVKELKAEIDQLKGK